MRLSPAQRRAIDPARHSWVEANAGSGKTHVLVCRFLRLLLEGHSAEGILCLTFTEAAATEMKSRVLSALAAWVTLDSPALEASLHELCGSPPPESLLHTARGLFPQLVDKVERLHIQTIHGFCQNILRSFSIEAGLTQGFTVMDESAADALWKQCWRQFLDRAAIPEDDSAFQALESLRAGASEIHLERCVKKAAERFRFMDNTPPEDYLERLDGALRYPEEPRAIFHNHVTACLTGLDRHLHALHSAGKTTRALAEHIRLWKSTADSPSDANVTDFARLFLLKDSFRPRSNLITQPLQKKFPDTAHWLETMQQRASDYMECLALGALKERSLHLFTLSTHLNSLYERQKQRQGALDYNDLLLKTVYVLEQSEDAHWLRYKLDLRINHLLMDETQDTSPLQWRIISLLTEEFFAGEGSHAKPRTLFSVGDHKQTIYGFQGASPSLYQEQKDVYLAHMEALGHDAHGITLTTSYRSTQTILTFVDALLAQFPLGDLLAEKHGLSRDAHPGKVVLLPLMAGHLPPKESATDYAWQLPLAPAPAESSERALAHATAHMIQEWLTQPKWLANEGRRINPSDILVLVRNRKSRGLMKSFLQACHQRSLPVSGLDRIDLMDHILSDDLMALLRFLILETDDLSLACLLKSPLFNLAEEELYALCQRPPAQPLFHTLRENAAENIIFRNIYARLRTLRNISITSTPFELLHYLVEVMEGRTFCASRFGAEADDLLDAWLSLAHSYQQTVNGSLSEFAEYVGSQHLEIKRETASSEGIRLSTVHGAKGLESPVVILLDNGETRTSPPMVYYDKQNQLVLWPQAEESELAMVAGLKETARTEQRHEYMRLLYVALTRARDELYLACSKVMDKRIMDKTDGAENWHAVLKRTMDGLPGVREVYVPTYHGNALVMEDKFHNTENVPPQKNQTAASPSVLPAYLTSPVQPSDVYVPSPSSPLISEYNNADTAASFGKDYGNYMHHVLHLVPYVTSAPAQEELSITLSKRYRQHSFLPPVDINAIRQDIVRHIEEYYGNITHLFTELPYMEENRTMGRMDLLALSSGTCHIIDYKTQGTPPENPRQVHRAILAQLSGYSRLCRRLFPDREIRACIYWTASKNIMEIPADLLYETRYEEQPNTAT